MEAENKYNSLHSSLEKAARDMQGVWAAFSAAGHHGLAAFAMYEAKERLGMADQIAQHIVEHDGHVVFSELPQATCDYPGPEEALSAMAKADKVVVEVINEIYQAAVKNNERVFFLQGLLAKMIREQNEVHEVHGMLSGVPTEDMLEVNRYLLEKYGRQHCSCHG